MDLLFKIEEGQNNVGQSDFVQHFPNINYSMSWEKIKTSIKQATNLYIKPTLGDIYDELAANYQGGTLSEKEAELVDMLQDAIANYTVLIQSNTTGVNLSELGLINRTDKDGTIQNISQWQYRNTIWNLTKAADSFFDNALEYIHNNNEYFLIEFEQDVLLINTAKQLSKHISTKGSHRAFIALKPFILKATKIYIKAILGEDLIDTLLEAIKANNLTDIQSVLLDKTQAVLADYALYISIPQLSIDLSNGNISILSESDGLKKYETANDNKLEALEAHTKRFAELQQKELLQFLNQNQEAFGIETSVKETKTIISSGGSVGLF